MFCGSHQRAEIKLQLHRAADHDITNVNLPSPLILLPYNIPHDTQQDPSPSAAGDACLAPSHSRVRGRGPALHTHHRASTNCEAHHHRRSVEPCGACVSIACSAQEGFGR